MLSFVPLGLGVNINVYQAFADKLAGGVITAITPLPIEFTAFSGKWVSGTAELNWATALSVAEATSRLALPTLAPGLYHVVLRNAAGQQLATQHLVVSGK